VQAWVDAVKADPLHADFLGLLRDPLVHRTLKRRVTFGVPLGQVFPDTPSDDRTMLMLAGDFEGPASDIQVVRPGGEPVPMQQVHAPDEFPMHDQSGTGPDSVRTVSARELVDSAITATQRHSAPSPSSSQGQRGRRISTFAPTAAGLRYNKQPHSPMTPKGYRTHSGA